MKGSAEDPLGLGGGDWQDDGLGGVYNPEGWTGRRTANGPGGSMRIFKAHLIKSGGFEDAGGDTALCPFDCQCCF